MREREPAGGKREPRDTINRGAEKQMKEVEKQEKERFEPKESPAPSPSPKE